MKIVARCIYHKPVTPSCNIIELDDATWSEFLYAKPSRRIEIVLKLTKQEFMDGKVRELAWIPLDDNMEVTIKKKRTQRTVNPTYKQTITKEQIETFRKEYQEECIRINNEREDFTLTPEELEDTLNRLSDDEIRYLLRIGSSASSRADLEMYYGN